LKLKDKKEKQTISKPKKKSADKAVSEPKDTIVKSGKNWKALAKRKSGDTLQNRDVYDSQQMERGTIAKKQTMTTRSILAGALAFLSAGVVWSAWSGVNNFQKTLVEKEPEIEEVTVSADKVSRTFSDVEYANMHLERTDYYSSLGYHYYDTYTKKFYTDNEYQQWAYVQKQLEAGNLHLKQQYDSMQGRWVWTERDYLKPADPSSVRKMTDLQWLNVTMNHANLYNDIGYDWADPNTLIYYTQAEYEHWLRIQQAAISLYRNGNPHAEEQDITGNNESDESGEETAEFKAVDKNEKLDEIYANSNAVIAEKGIKGDDESSDVSEISESESESSVVETDDSPDTVIDKSDFVPDASVLNAGDGCYYDENGNVCNIDTNFAITVDAYGDIDYTSTSFHITPEQYFSNKWRSGSYLTVENSGQLYLAMILDTGKVVAVATISDDVYALDEPVAVSEKTVDDTLSLHYRVFTWYDISKEPKREVITDQASVVPREFDDLTWANMYLVDAFYYADYGYTYADSRTAKYYTAEEYSIWRTVQQKLNSGELKFWRERSDRDDGYVYTDDAPVAGDSIRPEYEYWTDRDWMNITLVEASAYADKGWHYADPNTRLYYNDAEYAAWKATQDKIESGEIVIPQEPKTYTYLDYFTNFTVGKLFGSLVTGVLVYAILYTVLKRNLDAQNLLSDTSDINQYENDQHIALPEEIQRKFDWFPDVGAHSPVQVSSMVSHMMLNNKGLNPVMIAERAKKDILDENGDIEYYKGEILLDDDGNSKTKKLPMIDMEFGDALFEASGNPKDIRKYYDTTKIPYNPGGKDRTKQGGSYDTVAEMINNSWMLPEYEPQRPAGAYIVDTEPVNTMV